MIRIFKKSEVNNGEHSQGCELNNGDNIQRSEINNDEHSQGHEMRNGDTIHTE